MTDSDLVVVGAFLSRMEAEIAQGALQAAGVESVVSADDVGGQYVHGAGGVRLLVRSEDAEDAREVLTASTESDG